MATELLLHEKIPFTAPEEIGLESQTQRPLRSPEEEAAGQSALPEQSLDIKKVQMATQITGGVSLEPRLGRPISSGEFSPPQP